MKQFKSMLGVTLLEIMLVLAIAAMIIVMSIRYYQSATLSQQVNQTLGQIQAITSAADNLAIATGKYDDSTAVTSSNIEAIIGSANMKTATYGDITVTADDETNYTVTMQLNDSICTSVQSKLAATQKIQKASGGAPTCASGLLTYHYDNTQTN